MGIFYSKEFLLCFEKSGSVEHKSWRGDFCPKELSLFFDRFEVLGKKVFVHSKELPLSLDKSRFVEKKSWEICLFKNNILYFFGRSSLIGAQVPKRIFTISFIFETLFCAGKNSGRCFQRNFLCF